MEPGFITLGEVANRTEVLVVACTRCDWVGRHADPPLRSAVYHPRSASSAVPRVSDVGISGQPRSVRHSLHGFIKPISPLTAGGGAQRTDGEGQLRAHADIDGYRDRLDGMRAAAGYASKSC
jgi:hypothetical protein